MSISVKQGKYSAMGVMPGSGTSQRQIPMGAGFRGDPGFFGDLWTGIKGAASGAARGLLSGSPLGIVTGAIGGALGQKGSVMTSTPQLPPMMTLPTTVPFVPSMPQGPQNGGRIPTPGITGFMQRGFPGGETGYENGAAYQAGKASSPGYHWNKSGYFLKDGTWIEKGTKQVKNRRRNSLNPRALDRSMSRITSAKRASKKLGRITIRAAKSCR